MLSKQLETLALVGKKTKQVSKWTITIKKATTVALVELVSDTGEHVHWRSWGQEGNDKRKINRTVSWERLQLILRATRKTKQMMQNKQQAPYMEYSEHMVQRQTYFKRALSGLISPQGTNTTQIHFSFYILLASKGKQLARR